MILYRKGKKNRRKRDVFLRMLSLVLIMAVVTVTAAAAQMDDVHLADAPMLPKDPTTAPTQTTAEAAAGTTQTEPEQTKESAPTEPEETAAAGEAPQDSGSLPWKPAAILGVILLGCTVVVAGILRSGGKNEKRNATRF